MITDAQLDYGARWFLCIAQAATLAIPLRARHNYAKETAVQMQIETLARLADEEDARAKNPDLEPYQAETHLRRARQYRAAEAAERIAAETAIEPYPFANVLPSPDFPEWVTKAAIVAVVVIVVLLVSL